MSRSLSILLGDHEDITLKTIGTFLRESGHRVDEAHDGPAVLQSIKSSDYDLALIAVLLPVMDGLSVLARVRELHPDLPVVLLIREGTVETVIHALRLGVVDVLIKPISQPDLDRVLKNIIQTAEQPPPAALKAARRTPPAASTGLPDSSTLVGISPAIQRVREQIRQTVEGRCRTILITGETGTGKEVVAHAIHAQAGSEADPFIAVSCPTVPDSLVEAELFGHVKGSFTGATVDRAGYFEQAHGGTLFLDEIADFPAAVQATLLRVLETRTVRRVGGNKDIAVDLRVITATNAPLDELVKTGQFRRDLFYRLNIYRIHLLPLRARREDILPLAEHFLAYYAREREVHYQGFSPEAQQMLMHQDYPGNGRELRTLIERATLQCRSGLILPDHLDMQNGLVESTPLPSLLSDGDHERTVLIRALDAARWNRRQAARTLGIPYWTLLYRLKKLGIG